MREPTVYTLLICSPIQFVRKEAMLGLSGPYRQPVSEEGRDGMASNFEIDTEWQRDALYLRLVGDFDEASASTLLHALQDKCPEASVVFIKAKDVRSLEASGCDAFKRKLHVLKDWSYRLVFMDQNAIRLKPEWLEIF
jgi:ABC-type transporter Mla MlaB component